MISLELIPDSSSTNLNFDELESEFYFHSSTFRRYRKNGKRKARGLPDLVQIGHRLE